MPPMNNRSLAARNRNGSPCADCQHDKKRCSGGIPCDGCRKKHKVCIPGTKRKQRSPAASKAPCQRGTAEQTTNAGDSANPMSGAAVSNVAHPLRQDVSVRVNQFTCADTPFEFSFVAQPNDDWVATNTATHSPPTNSSEQRDEQAHPTSSEASPNYSLLPTTEHMHFNPAVGFNAEVGNEWVMPLDHPTFDVYQILLDNGLNYLSQQFDQAN